MAALTAGISASWVNGLDSTAAAPRATRPAYLAAGDNLQPFAGPRLIGRRAAVHDRQRRRLHQSVALPLGDGLPRIILPRGVERDPVGLDGFGFAGRQHTKRSQASGDEILFLAGQRELVLAGRRIGRAPVR